MRRGMAPYTKPHASTYTTDFESQPTQPDPVLYSITYSTYLLYCNIVCEIPPKNEYIYIFFMPHYVAASRLDPAAALDLNQN